MRSRFPIIPSGKHSARDMVRLIDAQPGWKAKIFKGARPGYDGNPDELVDGDETHNCLIGIVAGQTARIYTDKNINHPAFLIQCLE